MAFLLLLTFIFTGSIGLMPVERVKAAESNSKVYYVETDEDEIIIVQRIIANHENNFTIRYLASKENDFRYIAREAWVMPLESDGLYWNNSSYANAATRTFDCSDIDWKESYVTVKGKKWLNIDYKYKYDYKEYQKLYQAVRKIILDSNIANQSDYERIVWAYDWMCNNIEYDENFEIANPYDTFKNRKGMCVGYATLFNVFAEELGLNSRVGNGTANNGMDGWANHAWNIVELDGKWYHLDTTWGALHGSKYFLKGNKTFNKDHNLGSIRFDSELNYKISNTDFKNINSNQNSGVPARLYDINYDLSYTVKLNVGEKYNWLISNDTGIKLTYENSNPKVVSLTADGKVKALKAGKATLTAVNKELGIRQSIDIACGNVKVIDKAKINPSTGRKIVAVKVGNKISLRDEISLSKNTKFTCKDNMSPSTISIDGTTKKPQVIATVSSDGYVTGKSKGTIKVDVYNKSTNKLMETVEVTVK